MKTKTVYVDAVDFEYELGMTASGKHSIYDSIEQLKAQRTCWHQCGILKCELTMLEWAEPQNLSQKNKLKTKRLK